MEINYTEQGSPGGLDQFSGFVAKAYNAELYWPNVFPLYNRLRRSDPEVAVVRGVFSTVAAGVRIRWELPSNPSDDDKKFVEFGEQVLDDLEGGIERWRDTLISQAPFMGWAWWEAVPGLRQTGWTPPDDDPWRSKYNDGLIGFRRLGFRDHSSFQQWDLNPKGRLLGMWQQDPPHARVRLPLEQSVHVAFGDADNPEGLSPLESLWRLERIKYGLEVVQGIGYEHAAGHLSVNKTEKGELTAADKTNIRAAARAILSAQEGNYAAWPYGFTGQVMDVPFGSAGSILDAIRHYAMLKMALYNMQWVAMSTLSDSGSYAALKDSSALWLMAFNAMMTGFVGQFDTQFGARLYEMNKAAFPGVTVRPKLVATKAEKVYDLPELAAFMQAMQGLMPLGEDDLLEVRRRSGFLPESMPTNPVTTPTAQSTSAPTPNMPADMPPAAPSAGEMAALYQAARKRVGQIVELSAGGGARALFAELARGREVVRAAYGDAIYAAILEYLAAAGSSTQYKNRVKRAVVESFPEVFYLAYASGGGEVVDPEDDQWLTAKINAEMAYVDLLFQSMKTVKDTAESADERRAEANARADGYLKTLDAVYAEGLLRGKKNRMLTMVGEDGAESCVDCQRHKGKRYTARKWLRLGIPGVPGNGWECGGWKCQHGLIDDEGVAFTGA
jgi:hypothetical protein